MITKEEFTKYLTQYQIFDRGLERFSEALSGPKYLIPIFECDWAEAVGEMLDTFLTSHFTVEGADWITYYLFENIEDKLVEVTKPGDMFNEETKIEYHLNSIEELWEFLLTEKQKYFKDAE